MKVALVYDRVNKWGGAERVLLTLHELFPTAPLFTSVYNPSKAPWARNFKIKPSYLQKFPLASSNHEKYALFMPMAFENFSFDEFDVVISITSESAKGIITKPGTVHICYCLTPTRYLWSGYDEYFHNPLFRLVSNPAISYLRTWDKVASNRPDLYIAISKEVQLRIKKYYRKDSLIIYPPVTISETLKTVTKKPLQRPPYFLVVSRLVAYKRIDLAIKACNVLKLPLKIVGSGNQLPYLKSIAGPTVEFLGNLTDEELLGYYKGCLALLFPGKEDFGLAILEAQSVGKPVIAYKGGGALETIQEGKTGEFFYPQTKKALSEKLKTFQAKKYHKNTAILQSQQFGKEAFKKKLFDIVTTMLKTKKYS